ncbi:response regulator, partial [Methanospirillum sp.]|uniref:response regulator n=1 Tax=Methanospirillum sp. TaxID=45200 RepID=UPI002D7F3A8F
MIRILYVDDSREILDIGKALLEMNPDFRVDITLSSTNALTLLKQNTYHVIISDYFMPDNDGIVFLKQVRKYNKTIPFIVFTGRGDESTVIEALNSGADFYLKKGPEVRTLFTEISQIIHIL